MLYSPLLIKNNALVSFISLAGFGASVRAFNLFRDFFVIALVANRLGPPRGRLIIWLSMQASGRAAGAINANSRRANSAGILYGNWKQGWILAVVPLLTALSGFQNHNLPAVNACPVSRALAVGFWEPQSLVLKYVITGFLYPLLDDQYACWAEQHEFKSGIIRATCNTSLYGRTVDSAKMARRAGNYPRTGRFRTGPAISSRDWSQAFRGTFSLAAVKAQFEKRPYRLWRPRRPRPFARRNSVPGRKHWCTGRGFLVCRNSTAILDGTIAGGRTAPTTAG